MMRNVVDYLFVFDKSTTKEEFEFVFRTLDHIFMGKWPEAFVFLKQRLAIFKFNYSSSLVGNLTVEPWDRITLGLCGDECELCLYVSDFSCDSNEPKAFLNSYRLRRAIRNLSGLSVSQKKKMLKIRMIDREFKLQDVGPLFSLKPVSYYVYRVYKTKESLE